METSTQIVQTIVSSTGGLISDSIPLFELGLGIIFAAVGMFFVLEINRRFRRI